jgi:hypothetical protein
MWEVGSAVNILLRLRCNNFVLTFQYPALIAYAYAKRKSAKEGPLGLGVFLGRGLIYNTSEYNKHNTTNTTYNELLLFVFFQGLLAHIFVRDSLSLSFCFYVET